jgi:hypothetical protein
MGIGRGGDMPRTAAVPLGAAPPAMAGKNTVPMPAAPAEGAAGAQGSEGVTDVAAVAGSGDA